MIFNPITKLHNYYILRNKPIPQALWISTTEKLPLLKTLNNQDLQKLKKLTTLFLHKKTFTGVKGFKLDEEKCLTIALQACLLILQLDLSYYDGWVEVVVYPDTFVVYRNITDNFGLVHDTSSALSPNPQIETRMRVQVFGFIGYSKNTRFTRRLIAYFWDILWNQRLVLSSCFLSWD